MKVKKGMAFQIIGGEAFIVDPKNSLMHNLNETGTLIFKGILKGKSRRKIVSDMVGEFDVTPEEALKDCEEFEKLLFKNGILE